MTLILYFCAATRCFTATYSADAEDMSAAQCSQYGQPLAAQLVSKHEDWQFLGYTCTDKEPSDKDTPL